MSVIQARELSFAYPRRAGTEPFELRLAVWSVERGERTALHGPSGCGKSTLLNLLAGVLTASSGMLKVQGQELSDLSEPQRRAWRIKNLGFVFQDFPLVDYLDAQENVLLPYRLNSALTLDGDTRRRASDLLDRLGLGGKLARRPEELSQGERQRVAIARALVTEPGLLLADEPTAGLDPARSAQVMELLEGLCEERGLTLLLVTHDPGLLARFSRTLSVGELSAGGPA